MKHHIEGSELVTRKITKQRFRKKIIEAWDSRCYICGEKFEHITLDHLVAKKNGGLTIDYNLAPCCSLHNRQKGHRELWEFWTQHPCWDVERAKKLMRYMLNVSLEELWARPPEAFGDIKLTEYSYGLPFLWVPHSEPRP